MRIIKVSIPALLFALLLASCGGPNARVKTRAASRATTSTPVWTVRKTPPNKDECELTSYNEEQVPTCFASGHTCCDDVMSKEGYNKCLKQRKKCDSGAYLQKCTPDRKKVLTLACTGGCAVGELGKADPCFQVAAGSADE